MAATVLVALPVLATLEARAGQSPDPETLNGYGDKTVWITVYDLAKTRHLDWGCVKAGGSRRWTSGGYAFGSFYYVRGEVYDSNTCQGRKVCDTTVQINPQVDFMGSKDNPIDNAVNNRHGANTHWVIKPNGANCYWEKTDFEPQPGHDVVNTSCPPGPDKAYGLTGLGGPYAASCKDCFGWPKNSGLPLRDALHAVCTNNAGAEVVSELLDVSRCKPNTIRNVNGQLQCDR
jgi:hypothetical protein